MALSLDAQLTGATPPEAPLDMPVQDLRSWQGKARQRRNGKARHGKVASNSSGFVFLAFQRPGIMAER